MQVTVKAFAVVPSRSGVLRPPAEREVLNLFGARMAAVALSGYIFFGSSLSISDQVAPHPSFHTPTQPSSSTSGSQVPYNSSTFSSWCCKDLVGA